MKLYSSSLRNCPKLESPNVLPWINGDKLLHPYNGVQRDRLLMQATTQMNLKGILLSKRSQSQKVLYLKT